MDQKKTVDQLNLTGFFFQDYCAAFLQSSDLGYLVRTEEPFTFPQSDGPILGRPGSIDVLAVYSDSKKSFCFSIECKRAIPSIKNWLFFKTRNDGSRTWFLGKSNGPSGGGAGHYGLLLPQLNYANLEDYELCDHGIEINESFEQLNRNQEEKVYRSLLQAHHGLVAAFVSMSPLLAEMCNRSEHPMYYIPVVLTTANLYLAEFDPSDVNPDEGILHENHVRFTEKRWIEYEFGLPDYLADVKRGVSLSRRSTFIVNSRHMEAFFSGVRFPSNF
jgi:hypothetical protein